MSIHALKKLVPPPESPSEIGNMEQWQAVERHLGLVLPSDYRDFVFTYGSGLFARLYRVYNPFAHSEYTSLPKSVERVCGWQRDFKHDWPHRVPYAIYPEQHGILP